MKYCSAYLWEKGKKDEYNPVSLVLQHVQVRKQAVLLVCVCRGKVSVKKDDAMTIDVERDSTGGVAVEVSGYFTEVLVEWFHRECLELLERKCGEAEPEKSLQKEVETVMREIKEFTDKRRSVVCMDAVGILLVEQRFWLFSIGDGQVFLLNRRYNRKHMRQIIGGRNKTSGKMDDVHWESGMLQNRLGLLLCAEAFWAKEDGEEIAEVLLMDGEIKEEQLQRRLQEVWELRGNKEDSVGAVYIRTY